MSLDWNRNDLLDAADYMITEMLNKELEEKKGDGDKTNCKCEKST